MKVSIARQELTICTSQMSKRSNQIQGRAGEEEGMEDCCDWFYMLIYSQSKQTKYLFFSMCICTFFEVRIVQTTEKFLRIYLKYFVICNLLQQSSCRTVGGASMAHIFRIGHFWFSDRFLHSKNFESHCHRTRLLSLVDVLVHFDRCFFSEKSRLNNIHDWLFFFSVGALHHGLNKLWR
jgi:hypothetical protein